MSLLSRPLRRDISQNHSQATILAKVALLSSQATVLNGFALPRNVTSDISGELLLVACSLSVSDGTK